MSSLCAVSRVLLAIGAIGIGAGCGGGKAASPSGSAGSTGAGGAAGTGGGGAGGTMTGGAGDGGRDRMTVDAAADQDATGGNGGSATVDAATEAGPDGSTGGRCAPLRLWAGKSTTDAYLVDVDKDGRLDIVTAQTDGQIAIFRQNGARTFADPTLYDVSPFYGDTVAAGDLNEDGAVDLAISEDYGSLALLTTGPGGLFSTRKTMPSTMQVILNDIAIADLDGDGHLDIAFPMYQTFQVGFLWATGPAVFGSLVTQTTCHNPKNVLVFDGNEDQRPDLLVGCVSGPSQLMLNNGGRSFKSSGFFMTTNVPAATVGDVNRDGHADIVLVDSGSTVVYVLLGDGQGAFDQPTGLVTKPMATPLSTALGDFDHDGMTDLLIGYTDQPWLVFHRGMGDGHFQSAQTIPAAWSINRIRVADIDGDGVDDFVANDWGTGFSVYFGPCP